MHYLKNSLRMPTVFNIKLLFSELTKSAYGQSHFLIKKSLTYVCLNFFTCLYT